MAPAPCPLPGHARPSATQATRVTHAPRRRRQLGLRTTLGDAGYSRRHNPRRRQLQSLLGHAPPRLHPLLGYARRSATPAARLRPPLGYARRSARRATRLRTPLADLISRFSLFGLTLFRYFDRKYRNRAKNVEHLWRTHTPGGARRRRPAPRAAPRPAPVSQRIPARCGTGASSLHPRPNPGAARNSGSCETRVLGAASTRSRGRPRCRSPRDRRPSRSD